MKINNDLEKYFPKETPYEILDKLLSYFILTVIMNTLNIFVIELKYVIIIDVLLLLLSIFLKLFHRRIVYFYYFYKGILYAIVGLGSAWISLLILLKLDNIKNLHFDYISFEYKIIIIFAVLFLYLVFIFLNIFLGKKAYFLLYKIVINNIYNLYILIPLFITFIIEFFFINQIKTISIFFIYMISYSVLFLAFVFFLNSNYYIYTFFYFKEERYIFNPSFYDYCEWFNRKESKKQNNIDDISFKKGISVWGIFFAIIGISTLFSFINIEVFNFVREMYFEDSIILFIDMKKIEKVIYCLNYILSLVIMFRITDGKRLKIRKFCINYKFVYPLMSLIFLGVNVLLFFYYIKITDEEIYYRNNIFQSEIYDIDKIETIEVSYYYDNYQIKIKYQILFENEDTLNFASADNYIYKAVDIDNLLKNKGINFERMEINKSEYIKLVSGYENYIESDLNLKNVIEKIFVYRD